ncbi:MAG: hypothetical protein WCJ02_00580, partial [bacterium]
MNTPLVCITCTALLSCSTTLLAQTNTTESVPATTQAATGGLRWDAGADIRLQEEMYENIPGVLGGDFHNYFRLRTRAWGQVENDDFRLYLRFANEFF